MMIQAGYRFRAQRAAARYVRAAAVAFAAVFLPDGSFGQALPRDAQERESPHFIIYFEPKKGGNAEAVQLAAEDAFRSIALRLRFTPDVRIPVILYSRRVDFQRNARIRPTDSVVGTASSANNSILLDGSEVLADAGFVVAHEVAHVFLFEMLGPRVEELPLWLHEGLAQELGGEDPRSALATVTAALYEERLPPLSDLAHEFPPSRRGALAYSQAQNAVDALLARGGWDRMLRLLGDVKDGRPFDKAFEDAYGMSLVRWDVVWMRSLRAEARRQGWIRFASWIVPLLMFIALGWGVITVRGKRLKQIRDEEPVSELEPPSWWREDEFRR